VTPAFGAQPTTHSAETFLHPCTTRIEVSSAPVDDALVSIRANLVTGTTTMPGLVLWTLFGRPRQAQA